MTKRGGWRLGAAVLLVGLAQGCGQADKSGAAAKDALPDDSLALQAYLDAGLPPVDKPWTPEQCEAALGTLKTVGADWRKLPRLESEKSGAVFHRIIDRDKWAGFEDPATPVQERIPEALRSFMAMQGILMLYAEADAQQVGLRREALELSVHMLYAAGTLARVMDEFVPTIDPNDPTYEVRMNGLQRMRNGMATMVNGVMQVLAEGRHYGVDNLTRFARQLCDVVPPLLPHIEANQRNEYPKRVQTLMEKTENAGKKAALGELKAAIEKKLAELAEAKPK